MNAWLNALRHVLRRRPAAAAPRAAGRRLAFEQGESRLALSTAVAVDLPGRFDVAPDSGGFVLLNEFAVTRFNMAGSTDALFSTGEWHDVDPDGLPRDPAGFQAAGNDPYSLSEVGGNQPPQPRLNVILPPGVMPGAAGEIQLAEVMNGRGTLRHERPERGLAERPAPTDRVGDLARARGGVRGRRARTTSHPPHGPTRGRPQRRRPGRAPRGVVLAVGCRSGSRRGEHGPRAPRRGRTRAPRATCRRRAAAALARRSGRRPQCVARDPLARAADRRARTRRRRTGRDDRSARVRGRLPDGRPPRGSRRRVRRVGRRGLADRRRGRSPTHLGRVAPVGGARSQRLGRPRRRDHGRPESRRATTRPPPPAMAPDAPPARPGAGRAAPAPLPQRPRGPVPAMPPAAAANRTNSTGPNSPHGRNRPAACRGSRWRRAPNPRPRLSAGAGHARLQFAIAHGGGSPSAWRLAPGGTISTQAISRPGRAGRLSPGPRGLGGRLKTIRSPGRGDRSVAVLTSTRSPRLPAPGVAGTSPVRRVKRPDPRFPPAFAPPRFL